ncbi:MAG: glycosyltransferase family 39 protein [Thermoanaerobaculum sp.]|nr:glycosyltransferase family 39 protein [Thermoanaerobaculum sp.]MDW7967403.1 glycosyltransferase family 39 protein [Thermoanaerobaculum sp.]
MKAPWEGRWVVLVVLAACGAAAAAGWNNSATNDEPYFTLGAYYAIHGEGLLVVEHPPLYKLAAGIPLLILPLPPPREEPLQVLAHLPEEIQRFLHHNTVGPLAILRAARLGALLFLPVLLWGVWRLGELVGGAKVGWFSVLALACQPLVLGHAFVVHTDVPAAACWVWAAVFAERLVAGRKGSWLGLGLWLGLALAAKHSGLLLAALVLLRLLGARLQGRRVPWWPLTGVALLSAGVPLVLTAWSLRQVSAVEVQELVVLLAGERLATWSWVGRFLGPLAGCCQSCGHWLLGLLFVLWNNAYGQGVNFFFGQLSPYGFPLYFPVALIIKLSLPFTLLWWLALGRWRALPAPGRWLTAYSTLYLLASLGSAFNIGARHLMPVVAWLAALAGCALARLGERWRALFLAGLAASPAVSFPHYIAHFSLLVGGARGGAAILNDSNLDWGQDWARVAARARRQGWHPLFAVYLGADDPAGYGVPVENVLHTGRLPLRGYVAVSSWAATVGPDYLERFLHLPQNAHFLRQVLRQLRGCQLVEQVGHSIRVYRCGESP